VSEIDYTVALKSALAAAESAELARLEVEGVFEQLRNQILTDTESKISIIRKTLTRPAYTASAVGLALALTRPSQQRYQAIVAEGGTMSTELGEFETNSTTIYPCRIKFGDVDMFSRDKAELQGALFQLMSNPLVGRKIKKILDSI
jgi:hypothetical protein